MADGRGTRIHRRRFLGIGGAAALGSLVGSGAYLPWGIARASASEVNDVRRYGAYPGAPALTEKLQDAIDASYEYERPTLYVNPASAPYDIATKLYHRSGLHIYGQKSGSHIRNTNPSPAGSLATEVSVFSMGNYNAKRGTNSFEDETFFGFYGLSWQSPAVRAGSDMVYAPESVLRNFKAGDAIIMRNSATWGEVSGYHRNYTRSELNVVRGCRPNEGSLRLKYPVTETFDTLYVAKSGGNPVRDAFGQPLGIVVDSAVTDLTLSQAKLDTTWGIFAYGGMINCRIANVDVPQANAFASLNGVSRSVIDTRGCTIRVRRKVFDIAYYSHDSYIYADNLYRLPGGWQSDALVYHGDGAHHCHFRLGNVNVGYSGDGVKPSVYFGLARSSTFQAAAVRAPEAPGSPLRISGSRHCKFTVGTVGSTSANYAGVFVEREAAKNRIEVRYMPGKPRLADVVLASGCQYNALRLPRDATYRNASGNRTNARKLY